MDSRIAFLSALAVLLAVVFAAAPAFCGVLRYEDPWSRPNNYEQAPGSTTPNPALSEETDLYGSQPGVLDSPAPLIRVPKSDRAPVRFDTWEDNWYDRM